MSQALTTAHSVVAPTPLAKRIAATIVILYALVSMIPLAWIVEAKLVLNDELMKRGAESRAARLASEQQQTSD